MNSSWGWLRTALLVAGAIAGLYVALRKPVVPLIRLPAADASAEDSVEADDPCDGKPRCLVVYVAPWCTSCAQARPVIMDIKQRFNGSAKLGIKTVVGMDSRSKLEAYARGLGPGTFLDPDQAFSRAASVRSIPSWLVLDSRRRVLKRMSGAYPDAETQLQELGLDPVALVQVR